MYHDFCLSIAMALIGSRGEIRHLKPKLSYKKKDFCNLWGQGLRVFFLNLELFQGSKAPSHGAQGTGWLATGLP